VSATAGFGGGFVSGILGGGGGAVMVPLMTGPLRMKQHMAHGTSLAVISVTALTATVVYAVHEPLSLALVLALGLGSIGGAVLGAKGANRLPALQLRQVFGVFLIVVALRLLVWDSVEPLVSPAGISRWGAGAAIGFVGGVLSGALGVGGGSIFVPALVLILGIGQHEAQGISLWVVVIASVFGGWAHYRQGTMDLEAARWIVPAAIPGAVAGAIAAIFLSARTLQAVFATLLVAIGVQMLATARMRLRRERRAALAVAADAA
jgi:uncharacterized membrane protein YfcA